MFEAKYLKNKFISNQRAERLTKSVKISENYFNWILLNLKYLDQQTTQYSYFHISSKATLILILSSQLFKEFRPSMK